MPCSHKEMEIVPKFPVEVLSWPFVAAWPKWLLTWTLRDLTLSMYICPNWAVVGLLASNWSPKISLNYNLSLGDRNQFHWRNWLLWKGRFYGIISRWSEETPFSIGSTYKSPGFLSLKLATNCYLPHWRKVVGNVAVSFYCLHGTGRYLKKEETRKTELLQGWYMGMACSWSKIPNASYNMALIKAASSGLGNFRGGAWELWVLEKDFNEV